MKALNVLFIIIAVIIFVVSLMMIYTLELQKGFNLEIQGYYLFLGGGLLVGLLLGGVIVDEYRNWKNRQK